MDLHLPEEKYQEALQEWMYQLPLRDMPPLILMTIARLRDGQYSEEEAKAILARFRPLIDAWKKNNIMLNIIIENTDEEEEPPLR
jgi:hypothetical protein